MKHSGSPSPPTPQSWQTKPKDGAERETVKLDDQRTPKNASRAYAQGTVKTNSFLLYLERELFTFLCVTDRRKTLIPRSFLLVQSRQSEAQSRTEEVADEVEASTNRSNRTIIGIKKSLTRIRARYSKKYLVFTVP